MTEKADGRQEGGTHYVTAGVQPWNVIDTWPIAQRVGAYRAGALKYVCLLYTSPSPRDA